MAMARVARPTLDFVIKVGTAALYEGQSARVVGVHPDGKIHIKLVESSKYAWVEVDQLRAAPLPSDGGEIADLAATRPEQEQAAMQWRDLLAEAAKQGRSCLPAQTAKAIAAQMGVSERTVWRRWDRFRRNPTPGGLLPGLPGPVPGSRRLRPAVESIIDRAIDEVYLVREPATVTALVAHCALLARGSNVAAPSRRAVEARIRSREPLRVAKKRLGYHTAMAVQSSSVSGLNPSAALEMVQIDHALMDLIVVSPLTRLPIGRPWITVAIDVFTRCVLGYYLSFDTPNQTSVALALEHACFPKQSWLKRLGLEVAYPVFGKMKSIHWDNAKTFQAKEIKAQCARYGIHIQERPVRSPHYGAYVERYIGTMMGAVHLLPGTTFSNVKARGEPAP